MKVFTQPAWYLCFFLFLLHQFIEKIIQFPIPWADNNLDCLLCMPILLGGILAERRWFLKSNTNYVFSALDTAIMVIVFAILFEEGYPRWFSWFTKDYWDYLSYFIGGLFFYFFINKKMSATE